MYFKFLLIQFLAFTSLSFAGEMTVVGEYHGKNLYVQNPYTPEKKQYCVEEIFLNNTKINTDINTSAFEVDLSGLSMHSEVIVKIVYKDDCKPKILNLNVIKTHVKFHFNKVNIDDKFVSWTTVGEKLPGKFYIEKSLHNSWVVIKEMVSLGGLGNNQYQTEEIHHSGSNKYRIKFKEGNEHFHYSKVIEYHSGKNAISFSPKKTNEIIKLSDTTNYEVVDAKGTSLLKGRGKTISVSHLAKGQYFLNIDNRTEKFTRK